METSSIARFADLYETRDRVVPAAGTDGVAVCVLHDGAGRVYLHDGLPTVRVGAGEPVAFAVERAAQALAPGATIGGLVPFTRLRDASDGSPAGIAVVATLVRAQEGAPPVDAERARAALTPFHRVLLDDALARLGHGIGSPPLAEIESAATHVLRQRLHRAVVAPLLHPLSSRLLRDYVRSAIGDAESVVDVSCGDDALIVALAAEGRACVANDVCLDLMRAHAREGTVHGLAYTLHNVVDLPYSAYFEAAVCKNTLHHLNADEASAMFAQLGRIASRIVVLDVLDVTACARARFFNAYYRRFLGDQGRGFLTLESFRERIAHGFPGREIAFTSIDTLKGRYALAHVH